MNPPQGYLRLTLPDVWAIWRLELPKSARHPKNARSSHTDRDFFFYLLSVAFASRFLRNAHKECKWQHPRAVTVKRVYQPLAPAGGSQAPVFRHWKLRCSSSQPPLVFEAAALVSDPRPGNTAPACANPLRVAHP